MKSELTSFIASILRPPAEVIKFIFEGVYKLLFGRADVRLSKRQEEELAEEIRRDISFLFTDFGGRIVPDPTIRHPLPFDYAYVVIEAGDLRFRFFRGRDELRVWVAPKHSPGDWEDLSSVLTLIDSSVGLRAFSSFSETADVLKPHVHWLQENFSEQRYPEVQAKMADIHSHERAAIRQWETEINRTTHKV